MTVRIDLLDQRFGHLTVIAAAPTEFVGPRRAYARWECRCDCGNTCIIRSGHLRHGHTASCGCQRGAARRTPAAIARRAKALYLSGKTLKETARALGYSSEAHMRVLLQRQGVALRPAHPRPRVSTTELLLAYERLGSQRAVDRLYRLSPGTTCKRLRKIMQARKRHEEDRP